MFFERPKTGEVTILVQLSIESDKEREDPIEFEELALSAGALPVEFISGLKKIDSAGNLLNGSTASFIAIWLMVSHRGKS